MGGVHILAHAVNFKSKIVCAEYGFVWQGSLFLEKRDFCVGGVHLIFRTRVFA